jgi:hypothetical protein
VPSFSVFASVIVCPLNVGAGEKPPLLSMFIPATTIRLLPEPSTNEAVLAAFELAKVLVADTASNEIAT